MSYKRPESLSRLTTGVAQLATLGGIVYGAAMMVSGAMGLPLMLDIGTALMGPLGQLGSGVILSTISAAGFASARTAVTARRANEAQLSAIREAEKTGVMPDTNPYRLLSAVRERSPLVTSIAKLGGGAMAVVGAVAGVAALMGGPSFVLPVALMVIGVSTYKVGRTADDAREFAEQRTREASRALRNLTPATEWAQAPEAMVGVQRTYPAGYHAQKYLDEQAAKDAALLEDSRGR